MFASIRNIIMFILQFVFYLIILLLASRLLLKALEAGQEAPIVKWIYGWTNSLLHPFNGMFKPYQLDGGTVEFSTLAGLIFYIVIGVLIIKLWNEVRLPNIDWGKYFRKK